MAKSWQRRFPLHTGHRALDALLVAVPVAFALHYLTSAGPVVTFAICALAIIPLAGALGQETEDLSAYTGPQIGGLVNATMGNATELIIAFFALRAGHPEVVKASLSGSIIGNILLVFGTSALVGGLGKQKQQFSRQAAGVNSTMLFIAVVALVVPAVYSLSAMGASKAEGTRLQQLSDWTSVILILIYLVSLLYSLLTRRSLPLREQEPEKPERSLPVLLLALAATTVLIAFLSEILVGQIEQTKQALGISELFLGVIVIAIIGNAAEHATAVMMAARDKMELALTITVGSSVQIALLVSPLLVLASWALRRPMSLVFSPLEIAGIALAVLIVQMISADGETTWFEGAQLIAVYLILALAFYFTS
jgi:Ca2+:H+ antiporter